MSARVDHLVWFCSELEAGKKYFEARLARAPAYGGVHPGLGTRNSLLSLGATTYLEILARDPDQQETALDRELAEIQGYGLYHWAIAGVALEDIAERARQAGVDASDIVSGARSRPDGRKLAWRLVGLRNHEFGALVPFFIDWGASEHPSANAPLGGTLAALQLFSPAARRLNRLFDRLGIGFTVNQGPTAKLQATVEGGGSRHQLRSLEPLPRGFAI
jgi:hypothetical protein